MSQPKRIWFNALEKVKDEGRCRICGRTDGKLAAAHVSGRTFDKPKPGKKTRWVDPLDIIPLCEGPPDTFSGGPSQRQGCHEYYDAHQLDILSVLTTPEQARAVELLGSIESARRRLCPTAYQEESRG